MDVQAHTRTLSHLSNGSPDDGETTSSPSSVHSVPVTFGKTFTVPSGHPKAPKFPLSGSTSPEGDLVHPVTDYSNGEMQADSSGEMRLSAMKASKAFELGSLKQLGGHSRTLSNTAGSHPMLGSFHSAGLPHADSSHPSPEELGSLLQCSSVRSSPSRTKLGKFLHPTSEGSLSRMESFRRLSVIIKGPLTESNLDQFLAAYNKLRAQLHLARGDAQNSASDAMELKARSLLREAADKLEGAFRRTLEEQTRAADAGRLLRFACTRSESPENNIARRGLPSPSQSSEPKPRKSRDEFPGFQTSVVDNQGTRNGDHYGGETIKDMGASLQDGAAALQREDSRSPATSSGGSREREEGISKSESSSLPTFPGEDVEEAAGVQLDAPADVLSDAQGAAAGPREELYDVELPGVAWDPDTPAVARLVATGDAVTKVKRLAKAMIDIGLEDACLRVYRDVRGLKLMTSLKALEIGPTTVAEVERMNTAQADESIRRWKRQIKVVFHSVMVAERTLCSKCLSAAPWLSDQAFHHLGEDVLGLFVPVADALADGLKSEEKLVLLLDLYEALVYLMPILEAGFPEGACSDLRLKARNLLDKVKKAVKQGFRRLEDFIHGHPVEEVLSNGSYPERGLLTWVMRIVMVLSGYKETLETIFEGSQLKEVLELVLDALEKSIERQAKQYEDDSQSEFFLMNNLRYISCTVENLSFNDVLGDRWVNRRKKQVQQHATAYQKIAWSQVWSLLDASPSAEGHDAGTQTTGGRGLRTIFKSSSRSSGSAQMPRDKLEVFSEAVARLYWDHRTWYIPNKELREHLQVQLGGRLLDCYRRLVGQGSKSGGSKGSKGKQPPSLVLKEEIMQKLAYDLFRGHSRRSGDVPVEKIIRTGRA